MSPVNQTGSLSVFRCVRMRKSFTKVLACGCFTLEPKLTHEAIVLLHISCSMLLSLFFDYTDEIATYLHKQEPNMQKSISNSGQETFSAHKEGFLSFSIVMLVILTVGFLGNVLALLVLQQRDHRRQTVRPLMMNLALADIFIIVFGYPIAIHASGAAAE